MCCLRLLINLARFSNCAALQRGERQLQEGDVSFRVSHAFFTASSSRRPAGPGIRPGAEQYVKMSGVLADKELNVSEVETAGLKAGQEAAPQEPEAEATAPSAPRPRHTFGHLASLLNPELRRIAKELGLTGFSALRKDDLIIAILKDQAEELKFRFGGGTLEILPEGYGFLRPAASSEQP